MKGLVRHYNASTAVTICDSVTVLSLIDDELSAEERPERPAWGRAQPPCARSVTRAERPRSRCCAERGADVALPAKLGPTPGDAQGAASLVRPAERVRASTARDPQLSLTRELGRPNAQWRSARTGPLTRAERGSPYFTHSRRPREHG
jgi:hypothetical protein